MQNSFELNVRLQLKIIWFVCIILCKTLTESRNIDVDKAVAEFIAKRSGNGSEVDLNTWQAPEIMARSLVYYLSGFDDENRPIWVAEWGKWDVKKYVEAGGELLQAFDNYVDQQMVRMLQSVKLKSTEEEPVNELIFIMDFEDYPMEQLTSSVSIVYILKKFAGWAEIAYAVEKGFVINANFVAERLVNLVKPVLGRVFERAEIYGSNKKKWLPKLLRHIPRSEIPEWYGGIKDFKPIKVYGR